MPAPAAPAVAKAGSLLSRGLAARAARGQGGGDGGGPRPGLGLLLLVLLVSGTVVLALAMLVAVQGGVERKQCSPAGGSLPGNFSGPGSLGGVAGTGISKALVERVRRVSPYRGKTITAGRYHSTAYGPPWGGIQGAGIATSGGLPIAGGAPRWYMIATSPRQISHGTLAFIWPNPFGWKGPFLAADTGGAIVGNRIDFYDWRGRASQYRWGTRTVEVSSRPLAGTGGGSPAPLAAQPVEQGPGSAACESGSSLALGAPGGRGQVVLAPGADRPGMRTKQPVLDFLGRVAAIAGRKIIITTGTNHSQYSSSGSVSDHWVGLAADLGSVANGFSLGGEGGTRIAAAALTAAGVPEQRAFALARGGGGHDVCHRGWRVQVIWRTGDHYDHDHIGLRRGCSFRGVRTFQI